MKEAIYLALPTAETLFADYQQLKSVHRVGEKYGRGGQWVHKQLRNAGYDIGRGPEFTESQRERIRQYYTDTPHDAFDLAALAAELGKSKANVSRAARRMGLSMHKGGRRSDLGSIHFRSSWEANYARYLNLLVKMKVVDVWHYEPETFWFEHIKRGVRSYRPDFRVWYKGDKAPTYIEIKGWLDPKSKTKIARFRRFYSQHRFEVVGAKEYYSLAAKWASAIPNWETPKSINRVPKVLESAGV